MAWPGAWSAAAMLLVSGLVCWFWLMPQLMAERRSRLGNGGVASELAEVGEADLAGALSTMDLPDATLARLQKAPRSCGQKLAWVTLARQPGGAPETVRLRSGNHFSPVFWLPETPVRVAIPYPAPYESGRGSLTVLGATSATTVALTPAWTIPAGSLNVTHAVTWRPSGDCARL